MEAQRPKTKKNKEKKLRDKLRKLEVANHPIAIENNEENTESSTTAADVDVTNINVVDDVNITESTELRPPAESDVQTTEVSHIEEQINLLQEEKKEEEEVVVLVGIAENETLILPEDTLNATTPYAQKTVSPPPPVFVYQAEAIPLGPVYPELPSAYEPPRIEEENGRTRETTTEIPLISNPLVYTFEDASSSAPLQSMERVLLPTAVPTIMAPQVQTIVNDSVNRSSTRYHLPPLLKEADDPPDLPLPLSELQLAGVYRNAILEHSVNNVQRKVILGMNPHDHELYELLIQYQSALQRSNLSQKQFDSLMEENNRLKPQIWSTVKEEGRQQGRCGDKTKVFATYEFTRATFEKEIYQAFSETVSRIRSHVHGETSATIFLVAITRSRIEHFIYRLFASSPNFSRLSTESPCRVRFDCLSMSEVEENNRFCECLNVLFCFLRQPLASDVLLKDVRSWIILLSSGILRLGRSEDHLFLLCHILRSPSGFGSWAASLLQMPFELNDSIDLRQAQFDHVYALMNLLLKPIEARENFLKAFQSRFADVGGGGGGNNDHETWALVDSDGEDMEDESVAANEAWHRIHEKDMMALFEQIPLDKFYSHLLFSTDSGLVNNMTLLRSLSCAHQLLRLLECGAELYLNKRYGNLVKRIFRFIKLNLQFVTDHMELSMLSILSSAAQIGTDTSWVASIHSQYELFARDSIEVLIRITLTNTIGMKAWQFLSECPFRLLTVASKRIFATAMEEQMKMILKSSQQRQEEEAGFITFVLSSMSNLARECRFDLPGERRIITKIVKLLFTHTLLDDSQRNTLAKSGRDLISSITIIHPAILPYILFEISDNLDRLESMAIFLVRDMPFHLIVPTPEILALFSDWLVKKPVDSIPNQLARKVLSLFNWGYHDDDPTRLFIPVETHRSVAIMLALAFRSQTSPKQSHWLVGESMKMLTSIWSQDPLQLAEESFHLWCLDFVGRLRLHTMSRTGARPEDSGVSLSEEQCTDLGFTLPRDLAPSVSPVTLYVALLMTDWGHDIPGKFMDYGLTSLELLLNSHYQYRLTIEALLKVVQASGDNSNILLTQARFRVLLRSLAHGDDTYTRMFKTIFQGEIPCPILTTLTAMILNCCEEADRYRDWNIGKMCQFWLRCFISISGWHQDPFILHIIEALLSLSFRLRSVILTNPAAKDDDCIQEIFDDFLFDFYNQQIITASQRSGLSALINMGAALPCFSLLVSPPTPSTSVTATNNNGSNNLTTWPFLMWHLMRAEMSAEDRCRIWTSFQVTIAKSGVKNNNKKLIDIPKCLTKAIRKIKFALNYGLDRVSIYLILKTILKLPIDHPALPLLVQLFFSRFFEIPPTGLPHQGSNGVYLFDSREHLSLLKSLRNHFIQSSSLWQERMRILQKKANDLAQGGGGSSSGAGGGDHDDLVDNDHNNQNNNNSQPSPIQRIGFERIPLPFAMDGGNFGGGGGGGMGTSSDSGIFSVDEMQFINYLISMIDTFVLWLDEPRLHIVSLDLDVLPPIYQSYRIPQLRNGTYRLWVDMVNSVTLNNLLDSLIRPWRKRFTEDDAIRRLCRVHQLHGNVQTYERLQKRFQRLTNPVTPPNFTQPLSIVDEISAHVLGDHRLLSGIVQPLVDQLRQHLRKQSELNSRQSVLDMSLREYCPRLYEKREKSHTYQVPCSLGIPMPLMGRTRGCKGAANILVKFHTFEIRSDIQAGLEANRTSWNQVITEARQLLAPSVVRSIVTLEDIIRRLCVLSGKLTLSDSLGSCGLYPMANATDYENCAIALFYQLADQCNDDWLQFPVTRTTIAKWLHDLGTSFIQNNSSQSLSLLNVVLQRGYLISMVVEHFSPQGADGFAFSKMYADLTSRETLNSIAVSLQSIHENNSGEVNEYTRLSSHLLLLAKFNVQQWLPNARPNLAAREQLLTMLLKALANVKSWQTEFASLVTKAEYVNDVNMIKKMHNDNLVALVQYEYPSLIRHALMNIMKESGQDIVDVDCLNVLNIAFTKDKEVKGELSLPIDTIRTLLGDIRVVLSELEPIDRIFTSWSKQSDILKNCLDLLISSFWFKLNRGIQMGDFQVVYTTQDFLVFVWDNIFNYWLLAPIFHKPPANWTPNHFDFIFDLSNTILHMVFDSLIGGLESYKVMVLEFAWSWYYGRLIQMIVDKLGRGFLSDTMASSNSNMVDALLRRCNESLLKLPWHCWFPSLDSLEAARRLSLMNLTSINRFLIILMSRISWSHVLQSIPPSQITSNASEQWNYLDTLFHLTLQLLGANSLLEMPEVNTFLSALSTADWCLLSESHYSQALEWFRTRATPKIALKGSLPVGGQITKFLKISSGLTTEFCSIHMNNILSSQWSNCMAKQLLCVRIHSAMLVQCPLATISSGGGTTTTGGDGNSGKITEEVQTMMTTSVQGLFNDVLNTINAMRSTLNNNNNNNEQEVERINAHERALWSECLILVRNSSPGQVMQIIVDAICLWIDKCAIGGQTMQMTMNNINHLLHSLFIATPPLAIVATITETLLRPLFLGTISAAPPTTSTATTRSSLSFHSMWPSLGQTLSICFEQRNWEMFEVECVRLNSLLTLNLIIRAKIYEINQLNQNNATVHWNSDKTALVLKLLRWSGAVKIKDPDTELHILPLLRTLLQLLSEEASTPPVENRQRALRHVLQLLPSLENFSQDRSSSGLLGKIGLGKSSPLSSQFRLIMKSLYAYILGQCPASGSGTNQQLRVNSQDAGAIPQDLTPINARPPNVLLPTNQAMQACQKLKQLTGSEFQSLEEHKLFALQFITNSKNALPQAVELFDRLISDCYTRCLT